jgi:hypothetical protein
VACDLTTPSNPAAAPMHIRQPVISNGLVQQAHATVQTKLDMFVTPRLTKTLTTHTTVTTVDSSESDTNMACHTGHEALPSWVRYGHLGTLWEPSEAYIDDWLVGKAVRAASADGWTATGVYEIATGDRPKLWGWAGDCWCCAHKQSTCHSCNRAGPDGVRHGIISQALLREPAAKKDRAGCCPTAVWCSQCGARCCTHAFVCHACFTCNGGVDCTGGLLPVRKHHHRSGVG